MYRGLFSLLLVLVPGVCSAQQVFKCVNGKQVSYQSDPCPGQAVKAWEAVPDQDNPALRARLAQMEREVAARRAAQRPVMGTTGRGGGVGAGVPSRTQQSSSYGCQAARSQRAAVYNAAGHRRSFALSRSMDDAVYNACK